MIVEPRAFISASVMGESCAQAGTCGIERSPYLPYAVAALVLVPELISLSASILQRSWIGKPVPEELEGIYDPAEYATSNRYSKAKSNYSLCKDAYDFLIFFGFWFGRGFPWLDEICVGFGHGPIVTGLIYMTFLTVGQSVLDLPWSVYFTFVLEESFGFNKTTPKTFVLDLIKGGALAAVLGLPLLSVVLWFFETVGSNAWFYVWLTITIFQVVLLFLSPVLLLPIFMEMIPLPDGTALLTNEANKAVPSFVSGRLFYGADEVNQKPAWVTKDRRFQGASAGGVVSISWKLAAGDAQAHWSLAEGQPGEAGTEYATCEADVSSSAGEAKWILTTAGEQAVAEDQKKNQDGEDGPSSASTGTEPLNPRGLSTSLVNVGSLREKLLTLANRVGYTGANIYVIDGSSRSGHSNAFCTGFGRFRRICLYDTLLPLMTEDEIVAVLGHEIGHDRLYHVHIMLVFNILYMLLMFFALGHFLFSPIVSRAFFVDEPKVYLGVVLFSIAWSVVDFAVSIPMTINSRSNEFAADRFAVEADKTYGQLLGDALKKLMKQSKSNLTPHPLKVFLTYSHPPLDTRLKAIREHQALKYPE